MINMHVYTYMSRERPSASMAVRKCTNSQVDLALRLVPPSQVAWPKHLVGCMSPGYTLLLISKHFQVPCVTMGCCGILYAQVFLLSQVNVFAICHAMVLPCRTGLFNFAYSYHRLWGPLSNKFSFVISGTRRWRRLASYACLQIEEADPCQERARSWHQLGCPDFKFRSRRLQRHRGVWMQGDANKVHAISIWGFGEWGVRALGKSLRFLTCMCRSVGFKAGSFVVPPFSLFITCAALILFLFWQIEKQCTNHVNTCM